MTQQRQTLGRAGEAAACVHLVRQGYRILARNVRAGGVEIDVVASRAGTVVFVEVKTRRGEGFGAAAEAVDARKRARLVTGASAWLREQPRRYRSIRFDVITCQPAPGGTFRTRHWKAAFDASD